MNVACPRCTGPIRCTGAVDKAGLTITLNPFDVRRHALCFTPPPDGEPMPLEVAA